MHTLNQLTLDLCGIKNWRIDLIINVELNGMRNIICFRSASISLETFEISFLFSVFYATGQEGTVHHHKCFHSNHSPVHYGSVGVLAAARIRRESFTRNHSALVLLCVSDSRG